MTSQSGSPQIMFSILMLAKLVQVEGKKISHTVIGSLKIRYELIYLDFDSNSIRDEYSPLDERPNDYLLIWDESLSVASPTVSGN